MLKIDSVAALRRIPIGTKLTIVANGRGPVTPSNRVVKAVQQKAVVLCIDDAASPHNGQDSALPLERSTKCEPTADGFIISNGAGMSARYVFVVEDAPAERYCVVWDNGHASGTLSGTYDTEAEAESVGAAWKAGMVAADADPETAGEVYSYEVVPEKGGAR